MIQLECILERWELNSYLEGRDRNSKRIEAGKDVMINALTQVQLLEKKYLNGRNK